MATVRFIWKMDSDAYGTPARVARAIAVGIPAELNYQLDRSTGQSIGVAVPEADRAVHKEKLVVLKRSAIQAIPLESQAEEGAEHRFE